MKTMINSINKPLIHLLVASTVLTVALALGTRCLAENPIIQTSFTADPAPMVYSNTVYLYTSHDEDDARGFTMYNWLCYSTTDMANWTDHGIIGGIREPYKTFQWSDGNNAWAPQCIERKGKFYIYCPLPTRGRMAIGVAVSDSPTGPFTDAIGKPLISRGNGGDYDPTVFIDNDGQAYLYWGGNGPCYYVKLNEDMTSVSGDIQVASIDFTGTPREASYTEGPWLWREKDHYYLAWASRCCPEGIGYGMSDSPTGPWKCKGTIMDPNNLSSGNHPGILDYKGKSYVFGFNYALNWELTDVHRERRSVCVAEMHYDPDGTIQKVPWFTKDGVAQVGTFNPYAQVEAATICYEKGIKTKPRGGDQQGVYVNATENGAYIKVQGVDFGDQGAAKFLASVASDADGNTLTLRLDSEVGTAVGTLKVKPTGGLDKWETQSCNVRGARGVHDLYLRFFGNGEPLMNVDWWKFE
jgi:arabinoxylan arabinofuranohydrolase